MNDRTRALSVVLTLAALVVTGACNSPEAGKASGALPPEAVKLHLTLQGADPAFVQQLEGAVGFSDLDRLVQHLIQLLHTERDPKRRAQAALCLGSLAPNSVEPLTRALSDPDPDVAMYAAGAFVKVGPPGRQAIPELIKALHHDNWNVRFFAAEALGAMGPDPQSELALTDAEHDANPAVGKAATEALQRIGRGTSP